LPSIYTQSAGDPLAKLSAKRPEGNFLMGVVGAVVGAGIGAGVWFAIGYATNYELGIIAIVVGALAGWGALLLGKMHSPALGLAAAAGVAGIFLGSYAVYWHNTYSQSAYPDFKKNYVEALQTISAADWFGPEGIDVIARAGYAEALQAGEIEEGMTLAQYRKMVFQDFSQMTAHAWYAQMLPEEQEAHVREVFGMMRDDPEVTYFRALTDEPGDVAFMAIFGLLGLFYGYRVASSGSLRKQT